MDPHLFPDPYMQKLMSSISRTRIAVIAVITGTARRGPRSPRRGTALTRTRHPEEELTLPLFTTITSPAPLLRALPCRFRARRASALA